MITVTGTGSNTASATSPPDTITSPSVGPTLFLSGDCNAGVTISGGGVTLTGTGVSSRQNCRANNGKFSGKFYYTFTPGAAIGGPAFGWASGPTVVGTINTLTNTTDYPGSTAFSTGLSSFGGSGGIYYNNSNHAASTGTVVNGVTAAAFVDLDSDPQQVWFTPNITGTSGYLGGPLFNGSNTSSPKLPGSGFNVSDFTGVAVGLPGLIWYPIFESFNLDKATFNFTTNSTLEGIIGSSYVAWDDSGGAAPTPGPLAPMVRNVANAPPWTAGTSQAAATRVVAGPGHTPGGGYTSGQPLYLWAVTGSGGTTGGSQPAGFASCAVPAATGGGLDGSTPGGWSGATTVSDNGITWTCLKQIDYVVLSDLMIDDYPWQANAPYYNSAIVVNGGKSYIMTASPSSPFTCTSASSGGPTGTGSGITDGTCTWNYYGTLTYTSGATPWTHEYWSNGQSETGQFYNVNINLWYGGQARQLYQGGQNSELDPIPWDHHMDLQGDINPWCRNSWGTAISNVAQTSCNGGSNGLFISTITAAPGDSFVDNVTGSAGPLRVDSTKGVTLFSNTANTGSGSTAYTGSCIGVGDNYAILSRVQCHSTQWISIAGITGGLPSAMHANGLVFSQDIIQSDAGPGTINCDGGCSVVDTTIIYGGNTAQSYGFTGKFESILVNATLIAAPGTTNSTCISAFGQFTPQHIQNTGCFGFARAWALGTGSTPSFTSTSNNATDLASGGGVATYTISGTSQSVTSAAMPGLGTTCGPPGNSSTCGGLTTANQFVNPSIGGSLDLRVKNTSADIYGAAAAASAGYPSGYTNIKDIFNTTRPQSGRYDIGAQEFLP
jgi:hypothetical protein